MVNSQRSDFEFWHLQQGTTDFRRNDGQRKVLSLQGQQHVRRKRHGKKERLDNDNF